MIYRFLKAKHWQLFLLTFGIPIIFQFIMIGTMFVNIGTSTNSDLMINYVSFFPILMILFMGIFFGWFWAVAVGLQRMIPTNLKLNVRRFKISLLIPVFYILLFLGLFTASFNIGESSTVIFALLVPLHLFSMFCIFYCLYFVAKTFKTAELQREVTFSEFLGEFFMIWFFPIGIWVVQPKINEMVNSEVYTNSKN